MESIIKGIIRRTRFLRVGLVIAILQEGQCSMILQRFPMYINYVGIPIIFEPKETYKSQFNHTRASRVHLRLFLEKVLRNG